jgi:hypothetical protein
MTETELAAVIRGIAPVLKESIAAAVAPLQAEIDRLKAVTPRDGRDGLPGVPGPTGAPGEKGADGPCGPPGPAGHDAPIPDLDGLALKAASLIAPPKDGRDGKDADDDLIVQRVVERALNVVTEKMQLIVAGVDAQIEASVAASILKAVDTLPVPKDGVNGRDGADGRDGAAGPAGPQGDRGVDGVNGKDGADGLNGKDGVGIAETFITKDGELVLTMTDGTTKSVGSIVGAPGRDGLPGRTGERGADGIDGKDGLGFDDLRADVDDTGRLVLAFARGDRSKAFRVPGIVDRGVYKDGESYVAGDAVSWGGSLFIAQQDTTAKPETSPDWRLAVKRGREGREGKQGPQGPQGPIGPKGDKGPERW